MRRGWEWREWREFQHVSSGLMLESLNGGAFGFTNTKHRRACTCLGMQTLQMSWWASWEHCSFPVVL